MKTRELIERLKDLDPDGNMDVRVRIAADDYDDIAGIGYEYWEYRDDEAIYIIPA